MTLKIGAKFFSKIFHIVCSHIVEDGKHLVIEKLSNIAKVSIPSTLIKLVWFFTQYMFLYIEKENILIYKMDIGHTLSLPRSARSLIFTSSSKHHLDSVYLFEKTASAIFDSSILLKRLLKSSPFSPACL